MTDIPEIQFEPGQYTRKRLMVTLRQPKGSATDAPPTVVLEGEDGTGVAVAIIGPDSPAARADAARMMRLWNAALGWVSTSDQMPPFGLPVLCRLRSCSSGSIQEHRLVRVDESDLTWRIEDGWGEVSNNWDVIEWQEPA